jgi:hypothetical protein
MISRVEAGLDQLTPAQRLEIDEAVALLRNYRSVTRHNPRRA